MSELERLTWRQLDASSSALLAIPLGATEQHGPHLPFGVDTRIATALALGAAAELPELVVAPALPYGSSGEHAGFPGTLSIGQEATETLLIELGRNAAESFERTILVSAHGGNAVPLERAVKRLRYEGREVRAWSPSWGGDAHAGRTETSLMLALAPELVREELAEPGEQRPLAAILDELTSGGVRPLAANGVLGDPGGASAKEGRQLLADAIAELVAAIASWPSARTQDAAA